MLKSTQFIGTFGRRAGEKFVKSHGEGGLFGHLNSQLWGLICVYGETEQPLAQQHMKGFMTLAAL